MKKQTKIWKCKDGNEIRLCDMTDSHLLNCISFLERQTQKKEQALIHAGFSMLGMLQGELAIESVENGLLELEEDGLDVSEEFPIYQYLKLEAERRKLL